MSSKLQKSLLANQVANMVGRRRSVGVLQEQTPQWGTPFAGSDENQPKGRFFGTDGWRQSHKITDEELRKASDDSGFGDPREAPGQQAQDNRSPEERLAGAKANIRSRGVSAVVGAAQRGKELGQKMATALMDTSGSGLASVATGALPGAVSSLAGTASRASQRKQADISDAATIRRLKPRHSSPQGAQADGSKPSGGFGLTVTRGEMPRESGLTIPSIPAVPDPNWGGGTSLEGMGSGFGVVSKSKKKSLDLLDECGFGLLCSYEYDVPFLIKSQQDDPSAPVPKVAGHFLTGAPNPYSGDEEHFHPRREHFDSMISHAAVGRRDEAESLARRHVADHSADFSPEQRDHSSQSHHRHAQKLRSEIGDYHPGEHGPIDPNDDQFKKWSLMHFHGTAAREHHDQAYHERRAKRIAGDAERRGEVLDNEGLLRRLEDEIHSLSHSATGNLHGAVGLLRDAMEHAGSLMTGRTDSAGADMLVRLRQSMGALAEHMGLKRKLPDDLDLLLHSDDKHWDRLVKEIKSSTPNTLGLPHRRGLNAINLLTEGQFAAVRDPRNYSSEHAAKPLRGLHLAGGSRYKPDASRGAYEDAHRVCVGLARRDYQGHISRGLRLPQDVIGAMAEGETVPLNAVSSWTDDHHIAWGFADRPARRDGSGRMTSEEADAIGPRVVLRIPEARWGTPISDLSTWKNTEREILSGGEATIRSVEKKDHATGEYYEIVLDHSKRPQVLEEFRDSPFSTRARVQHLRLDELPEDGRRLRVAGDKPGGAHKGAVVEHPDMPNRSFLLKPVRSAPKALGEVAGSQIAARILGEHAVPAKLISTQESHKKIRRLGYKGAPPVSVIQEMVKNGGALPKDKKGIVSLPSGIHTDLLASMVANWVIGDHDAHGAQYLMSPGGDSAVRVDFGQSYKHLHSDRLDTHYHPNAAYGESKPAPMLLLEAFRDGEVDLDFGHPKIEAAISRAERISDVELSEMIKDYAEAVSQVTGVSAKSIVHAALDRKNNVREDMEAFFEDVQREREGDHHRPEGFDDPGESVEFRPGNSNRYVGMELNGVPFTKPEEHDWSSVPDASIDEPPMPKKRGYRAAAGLVMMEDDGRVWLVEPTNHFAGTERTFPKGGQERGLTLQQSALKEAYEESGFNAEIVGYLGDSQRTQSMSRYYLARRTGGNPGAAHWETQAVHLVTPEEARRTLNVRSDHTILGSAVGSDDE